MEEIVEKRRQHIVHPNKRLKFRVRYTSSKRAKSLMFRGVTDN